MAGIVDVANEFSEFSEFLNIERREHMKCIASLNNGFEGWIKLEFFLWLIAKHKLEVEEDDIGLEYKVHLDQRRSEMDKNRKQCDLWIQNHDNTGYHYVELKVPFSNYNSGKMFTSAGHDFWYMSRISASSEYAVTGNAIIIGVGFDNKGWQSGIDRVRNEAWLPESWCPSASGMFDSEGRVRWAIFTKKYT